MTDAEKEILSQVKDLRKEVIASFRECRIDISKVHTRINKTDADLTDTKIVLTKEIQGNKTKIGLFVSGITFAVTMIANAFVNIFTKQ